MTLPAQLLAEMDRLERNRSRFIKTAVEHELERRRREALLHSLRHPHPESAELADVGFDAWASGLPDEAEAVLVDPSAGKRVRWVEGRGFVEDEK